MKRLTIKTDRGDFSVCFWKVQQMPQYCIGRMLMALMAKHIIDSCKLTRDFNVYAWDAPGYA